MIQIVQCWDDGVEDDIRLCHLLRSFGAKASFNLNPGLHGNTRSPSWKYRDSKDVFRLAKGELREIYEGFTIANHSLSHPFASRISLAEWKREVDDGRKQLQDLFDQPIEGFAYPFGDYDVERAQIVREAGHVYARTCNNQTPCHPAEDSMMQPADCHHEAEDFWVRYEQAKAGGAAVFYFWGHSYEMVTETDWSALAEKYSRFNADPDAGWAELPVALAKADSL